MPSCDAIAVCLKYPQPGRVKTRLAAHVGDKMAANMYGEWIAEVFCQLQPLRPKVSIVGYFTGAERDRFSRWDPLTDDWLEQPPGDLTARLDFAFLHLSGQFSKVLVIGTDCLDIDAELCTQALELLDRCHVVLGPTTDGGYYLIGSNCYRAGLFRNIRWSTEHTLADQLQVCQQNEWSVNLLPQRSDIDTWEDWQTRCERLNVPPIKPSDVPSQF